MLIISVKNFTSLIRQKTLTAGVVSTVSWSNKRFYHMENILCDYAAPEWAKSLSNVPKSKVQLAVANTPIHRWHLPGVPEDFEVYIKRDDLTGSTLSGNKVRKLEFIFADAILKGCKHFITCGGIQSNYCRAAAVASAQLGLKPHLIVRSNSMDKDNIGCQGNIFLDRMCGADLYLAPCVAPYETELLPRMQQVAEKIKTDTGDRCYLSPVGGSDEIGFYGYLNGFHELLTQGVADTFDDIVFTTGSGGTAEGLAVGNFLSDSQLKIHAIAVCDDADYFYNHARQTFRSVGMTADLRPEDILDVVEGHKGQGYGLASQEDYDFICEVSRTTGIILDPTYTGKAARGMVKELTDNPSRFKGRRILFIHTGGVFGAYDGRLDDTIEGRKSYQKITPWPTLNQSPLS